ncbi:MAG: Rrf2 family protein [Pseudohongiellaceae bacterium]|jgi:Rrf2 family protein
MIRFSKMADYGVLVLGYFVRNPDKLAPAAELSEAFHMPRSVVANLLKGFREAGLLTSKRGLHGGYQLSRPPSDISLLEVLKVVDGPVHLTDCAASELADVCDYEDVCTSRSPLLAVNQRIVDILDGISLAEIIASNVPISSEP